MSHRELTGKGGKGSADRTSDIRKYQAEFDRIFSDKPKQDKATDAKPTT